MLRPALPNCWIGEFGLGVSCWKAAVLNHCNTLRGPEFGSPTRFGRFAENPVISGAPPCNETSFESNTVNGVPLMNVVIPFICQFPSACWYQACGWRQKGRLH